MRLPERVKVKASLIFSSFILILGISALLALVFVSIFGQTTREVSLAQVVKDINTGAVSQLAVTPGSNDVLVQYRNGEVRSVRVESNSTVLDYFRHLGVPASLMPSIAVQSQKGISSADLLGLGLALLAFFLYFFSAKSKTNRNPQNSISDTFLNHRARVIREERPVTRFSDVAGADEAKEELKEIVDFLSHPRHFQVVGAKVPRGALLVGPPGTGKTLLARAVAGESKAAFFSVSGSEFVEMFVGVGASRIRSLFEKACESAPSIVFIDEIDSVGRNRTGGHGGSNEEREQTLNQLLVAMDGFSDHTDVIVIAATNRPDILDSALLRPGRFDRQIRVDLPSRKDRLAILQVHTHNKPLATDVDLEILARKTPQFSGAELANLTNEAAIYAGRRKQPVIHQRDFDEAVERIIGGPAYKNRRMSDQERRVTAYHEMGHAIVARCMPTVDPVHKVSIVSRGSMGGFTMVVGEDERHLWTRTQFVETIAYALGGLIAEELMFGEKSTGASNDLERSTSLARQMVCRYGMSEKIGLVNLRQVESEGWSLGPSYSPETAHMVDEEIRQIVTSAYDRAHEVLQAHRARLVRLSEILFTQETLNGSDIDRLWDEPSETQEGRGALGSLPPLSGRAILAES